MATIAVARTLGLLASHVPAVEVVTSKAKFLWDALIALPVVQYLAEAAAYDKIAGSKRKIRLLLFHYLVVLKDCLRLFKFSIDSEALLSTLLSAVQWTC